MSDLVRIGDWTIPSRFAGGLARYVLHRVPTGDFLRAILTNDLSESVARGDDGALLHLVDLVRVVYNYVPIIARRDGVTPWLNGRGEMDSELEDAAIKSRYGRHWEGHIHA